MRDYEIDDIVLLKVGRHLRPAPHYKLIVARDDGENHFLEGYRKQFTHLRIESHMGPLTLIDGDPSPSDLELAARIAARFSQGRDAGSVRVSVHRVDAPAITLDVAPMAANEVDQRWHV